MTPKASAPFGSEQLLERHFGTATVARGTPTLRLLRRQSAAEEILEKAAQRQSTRRNAPAGETLPPRWRLHAYLKEHATLVDSLMSVVIVLNAVLIGVSLDVWRRWRGWIAVDGVFAFAFLSELAWKIGVLGCRSFFCDRDAKWHIFEAMLAVMAAVEVFLALAQPVNELHDSTDSSSMTLLRVVRLFRVTRIIRVCRFEIFQDLLAMMNGVLAGVQTLFWAVMLIFLPLYAMALVMRETAGQANSDDLGNESFGSVPLSFLMVFRAIVSSDDSDASGKPIFLRLTLQSSWLYGLLYYVVVMS